MGETRKLAAILVADVVGYSRLAAVDEDRTLARLRALRSDLVDPTIALHHGRVVKRTGDGSIIEFRSVVDAVRVSRRGRDDGSSTHLTIGNRANGRPTPVHPTQRDAWRPDLKRLPWSVTCLSPTRKGELLATQNPDGSLVFSAALKGEEGLLSFLLVPPSANRTPDRQRHTGQDLPSL